MRSPSTCQRFRFDATSDVRRENKKKIKKKKKTREGGEGERARESEKEGDAKVNQSKFCKVMLRSTSTFRDKKHRPATKYISHLFFIFLFLLSFFLFHFSAFFLFFCVLVYARQHSA